MRTKTGILAFSIFSAISIMSTAQAGQSCHDHEVVLPELKSAINVADQVQGVLERENSSFALIARVGSDISEHGLNHTHVGFVQKRQADGAWIVIHQLNSCASSSSGLFVQGLGTFMLDDLFNHEVLIVTLQQELGENLARVFEEGTPRKLHDPQYNMISYPGVPVKYQNSNEWILETLAYAQAKAHGLEFSTREDAHNFYLRRGFKGSIVRISPLKRSLASIAAENVRFDDHPPSSHREGRYEIVSVRSIVDYLQHTGDAEKTITIAGTYRRSHRRTDHPINDENPSD